DRSYGIHVAAVAGLPSSVIARARDVLGELERQRPLEPPEVQLGLPIEMAADPLRKELEDIDPSALSPLEALQKLYQLRARLSRASPLSRTSSARAAVPPCGSARARSASRGAGRCCLGSRSRSAISSRTCLRD